MKKAFTILLLTLVILAVYATPVFAEDNPAIAVKTKFDCAQEDLCVDTYDYTVAVEDINADMVMAEFSSNGDGDWLTISINERGTNGLISFVDEASSLSKNGKFRVTAFNFDRSTRLIKVIEYDRTGTLAFLPIVSK